MKYKNLCDRHGITPEQIKEGIKVIEDHKALSYLCDPTVMIAICELLLYGDIPDSMIVGAKQRVRLELQALEDKRDKLREFRATDNYRKLKDESRRLLDVQYDIMNSYITVLYARLECWED